MTVEARSLDKYRVESFTGRNFSNWCYIAKGVLRENEVEYFIVDIPQGNDEGERKKEVDCMVLLGRLFGDHLLELIRNCPHAYLLWIKINNKYKEQTVDEIIYLKRKFKNFKFDPERYLLQQFEVYDTLVRSHKEAHLILSEEDVAINLLLSLPNYYQNLLTEIVHMPLHKLTLSIVHEKILNGRVEIITNEAGIKWKRMYDAVLQEQISSNQKRKSCSAQFYCMQYVPSPLTSHKEIAEFMSDVENETEPKFVDELLPCNYVECSDKEDMEFVLDSGSSVHVVTTKKYLHSFTKLKKPLQISGAKDIDLIKAKGKGNLKVCCKTCTGQTYHYTIKDVFFTEEKTVNLLSVKCFDEEGFGVSFYKGEATLSVDENAVVSCSGTKDKLYTMTLSLIKPESENAE